MYAYLFFGLMITSFFLIIECVKNFRTPSLLKYHFIGLLVIQVFANFLSYSKELGFGYAQVFTITKITTSILIVNILILVVEYSISRYILIGEGVFLSLYAFFILKGFYFYEAKIGQSFPLEQMKYQTLLSFTQAAIFIILITYSLFRIIKKTNGDNLYFKKIRSWSFLISLFLILSLAPFIYFLYIVYYPNNINIILIDSRTFLLAGRSLLLLFILLRPRFINDAGLSFTPANFFTKLPQTVSNESFDFLFYKNHYYLNPEGNLEDFALKMNLPKAAVSDYVSQQKNVAFNDLLNQNRISYLKDLLELRKYNEFTIEALSEMAGFNNRRTMYNSFKRYIGVTPTEYIQGLK